MNAERLFQIGRAEALTRNSALSAETLDTEGMPDNTFLRAVAEMGFAVVAQAESQFAALFVETAAGDDLSRLASDRFGLERQGATTAVVTLTITRDAGATGALTVAAGTEVRTSDGVTFRLDSAAVWASGVLTALNVDATCTVGGTVGNVDAATLTTWSAGEPEADLVVTNAAAATGGNEAETDAELRGRVRASFIAAIGGTSEALERGALDVAKVRRVSLFENTNGGGQPSGTVRMAVADVEGAANAALATDVSTGLEDRRALGIVVEVDAATVVEETVTGTATFEPGRATSATIESIKRAIESRAQQLRPNSASTTADAPAASILSPGIIQAAAESVPGVIKFAVTAPTGDVLPGSGESLRVPRANITVNGQ